MRMLFCNISLGCYNPALDKKSFHTFNHKGLIIAVRIFVLDFISKGWHRLKESLNCFDVFSAKAVDEFGDIFFTKVFDVRYAITFDNAFDATYHDFKEILKVVFRFSDC